LTVSTAGNLTALLDSTSGTPKLQFRSGSGTLSSFIQGGVGGTANLSFQTNGTTERMAIEANGDISFYDDTGSTQGLFWDASAESLGIGTTSPSAKLDVSSATGSSSITPTELLISSSTQASDWSLTEPWGILGFYSADTSGGGAGSLAEISANMENTVGGFASLDFKLQNSAQSYAKTSWLTLKNSSSLATRQVLIEADGGLYVENNVGIGTSSPATAIHAQSSTAEASRSLRLAYDGTYYFDLKQKGAGGIVYNAVNANAGGHRWELDGSEKARIDSSGNLLVGTTSTVVGSATSGKGFRVDGANGIVQAAASGVVSAIFNRTSSDGDIVSLRKNGSTVGSIGVAAGELYIGSETGEDAFVKFGYGYMAPATKAGANSDNFINLGKNTSRFKDLYLSGGHMNGAANSFTFVSGGNASNAGANILLYGQSHSGSANTTVFRASGTESARFDSSGNLLVGTTSTNPQSSSSVEGVQIAPDHIGVGRSGNVALYLNRQSSDGEITQFRKDGSTVGNIGVLSSRPYFVSNNCGIRLGAAEIVPTTSSGANSNGAMDIGHSGVKFKDLYLSGTVNASLGYFSKSGGNNITINSTTANATFLKLQNSVRAYSVTTTYDGALSFYDNTGTSERARIDTSGNFMVGKTAANSATQGVEARVSGQLFATSNSAKAIFLNRLNSDGEIIDFRRDGVTKAQIGILSASSGNDAYFSSGSSSTTGVGLRFIDVTTTNAILPCRGDGTTSDNLIDLGSTANRFDDIYATNGTIQTSDRNEKQDIQELSDAEQRVATACKGLIRRYKFNSAVEEKGDDARYHFGVIAQDLQDAFTAEGLDAGNYGMFISSTWTDDDGNDQTRLGVRYNELLAFIITTL